MSKGELFKIYQTTFAIIWRKNHNVSNCTYVGFILLHESSTNYSMNNMHLERKLCCTVELVQTRPKCSKALLMVQKKLTLIISLIVHQLGEGRWGEGLIKSAPLLDASFEWIGGGRSSLRRSRGSRNCQWCFGEERFTACTRSRTWSNSMPPPLLAARRSRSCWSAEEPLLWLVTGSEKYQ